MLRLPAPRAPTATPTHASSQVGVGEGIGYTLNIPWTEGGAGDAEYLAAFDEVIMPVAHVRGGVAAVARGGA